MVPSPTPDLYERLFQATVERIRDVGYNAVPVSSVTQEVGVAKGTFFNYFPTKDHILAEALRRMLDRALETVVGMPGTEAILALLPPLAGELSSDRPLAEAIASRFPVLPAPSGDASAGHVRDEERLRSWFDDRLGEALPIAVPLVELDRSFLASLFIWALRGSLEEWVLAGPERASLEAAFIDRVGALLDAQGLPIDSG